MKIRIPGMSKVIFTVCIGLIWGLLRSEAAVISQSTNDSTNESSFNAGTHWSDSLEPSGGNDYTSSYQLRTPKEGGSYIFAGNSLTLNNGGQLIFKGTAATDVITVNNLIMNSGSKIINWTSFNFTMAGHISIATGQIGKLEISGTNYGFTVTSTISGLGGINFSRDVTTQTAYAVTLNAANTYSGGTTISAYAYAIAASSGAFGTGNVTVSGGKLELQNSSTISDSASLIFASSLIANSVTLNFTGSETVGALSLNGGSTYLAAGTYSIADLNAQYGVNAFTGTGSIMVIPEPSTCALFLLGIVALALLKITRKEIYC